MPRYVTRSDYYMDDHQMLSLGSITVHEDRDPVPTGLLDSHGDPIYRAPESVRCGFVGDAVKVKARKRARRPR